MTRLPPIKLAAAQHGVLSLAQGADHSFTRVDWRRWHRNGLVVDVLPGVARLAGALDTPLARLKAAALAVGPDVVVSHTSSAFLWGAPTNGVDPIHLVTRERNRRCHLPGLVLHRPRDVVDLDPVVRQRIPTTRPLRTLVDLGAVAPEQVVSVLRHFVATGLLPPAAVDKTLREHRRKGRHGVIALEAALAALALGSKPPDSWLEEEMARLFTRYSLPPFEFHAVACGVEVDFLVVGTNVVLEADGWATHGLVRAQFERDRERDALLTEAGYVVQRFTWHQITRRPGWVAARISGLLRTWAPQVLAP